MTALYPRLPKFLFRILLRIFEHYRQIINLFPSLQFKQHRFLNTQHALRDALKELTNNQAQLIEMEKLKTVQELSGAISHDFAQPLQVLSTYIGLIGIKEHKDEYIKMCQLARNWLINS